MDQDAVTEMLRVFVGGIHERQCMRHPRLHVMTAGVLLPEAKTLMMTRDCRDVLLFDPQGILRRRPSALKPQAGPRRWKCCRSLL
jgi:hypothetical protein